MKTKTKQMFLVLLLGIITSVSYASEMSVKFKTSGNCYTCKLRIEEVCNNIEGCISSDWTWDGDITSVVYDDMITDCHTFMQAIADVGHDTEWYQAPQQAYDELVGTCCEYDRIFSYDAVQIGYLSILDIWVFGLDIDKTYLSNKVSVYPNPCEDVLTLELDSKFSSDVIVEIMSINGNIVKTISLSSGNKISLKELESGIYVLLIKEKDVIISINKLNKI